MHIVLMDYYLKNNSMINCNFIMCLTCKIDDNNCYYNKDDYAGKLVI